MKVSTRTKARESRRARRRACETWIRKKKRDCDKWPQKKNDLEKWSSDVSESSMKMKRINQRVSEYIRIKRTNKKRKREKNGMSEIRKRTKQYKWERKMQIMKWKRELTHTYTQTPKKESLEKNPVDKIKNSDEGNKEMLCVQYSNWNKRIKRLKKDFLMCFFVVVWHTSLVTTLRQSPTHLPSNLIAFPLSYDLFVLQLIFFAFPTLLPATMDLCVCVCARVCTLHTETHVCYDDT